MSSNVESSLGNVVRTLRKELRLTQADVADKLGVDRVTVIQWEKDRFVPAPSKLAQLATLLGVEYERLAYAAFDPRRFPERLALAVKTSELSEQAFAKRIGVGMSRLAELAGGSRPTYDELAAISDASLLAVGYLALGQGQMNRDLSYLKANKDSVEIAQIPRYDLRLAAGVGATVLDETPREYLALKMSSIRRRSLDAAHLAYFEVAGDSMQPTLDDGDLVLTDLRQTSLAELREGIYACRLDGDVVVKYLERAGGDGLRLVSRNPNYPPRLISWAEVDSGWFGVIGRVCMVQHWFPVVNTEE